MFDDYGSGPSMEEMGLNKEAGMINNQEWSEDDEKTWKRMGIELNSEAGMKWDDQTRARWVELNTRKEDMLSKPLSGEEKQQMQEWRLMQNNKEQAVEGVDKFTTEMSLKLGILEERERRAAKKSRR